jgi:hypothetical protein
MKKVRTEIIFAKSVRHYDSYRDFWQLVELSGFPIISVSDIDITENQIVITTPMNGDYKEHFVGNLAHYEETGEITGGQLLYQKNSGLPRMSHLIIWNLERPAGSGSVPEYAKESMEWITKHRYADEVWVSDFALANETMLRYVTLGSDYGLGEVSEDKQYDFTHMSVTIPRRVQIYKDFKNGQIGPNCWPPERNEVLKRSRFALNVHQDNWGFCEPLRLALFAAYGLPVISETLTSGFPYGGDIQQCPYHNLVDNLKSILSDDYGKWAEMGLRLRRLLCKDLQFGKMVRQAIEESTGWR